MFLLGGTVGSFLNVVVYRLPAGLSLVHPGSHCPRCKHPIRWYDNVPILGWVLLGGRCRDCKAAIAVRYPMVEAFTAVLFLAAAVLEPSWQACAFHLVLLCTLLPAALIDYDGSPLPPLLALPALSVGLLGAALWPQMVYPLPVLREAVVPLSGPATAAGGLAGGLLVGWGLLRLLPGQRKTAGLVIPALVGVFFGTRVGWIGAPVALVALAAAVGRRMGVKSPAWLLPFCWLAAVVAWIVIWRLVV
jgi:leader peptidase (prepilin peptidase)/N-methyltransferase